MFKKICLIFFIAVILSSVYLNNFSSVFQNIKKKKNVNVLFIAEGTENLCDGSLSAVLFQYDCKNKNLKILFVDDAITVLRKKKKSKTLNEMFYERQENSRCDFIKREIESLFDDRIKIDYCVFTNTEDLYSFVKLFDDKKMADLFGNDYFTMAVTGENYNASVIYKIKIIKYVLKNLNRKTAVNIARFAINGPGSLKTDFKLQDIPFLYARITDIDVFAVRFADIATVFRRNRIEINRDELPKTVGFFAQDADVSFSEKGENPVKVEVLNGSEKKRMAMKAVDLLRKKGFDIYDWGTSYQTYKFTAVFDLTGNFKASSDVTGILGCGEIVFKPETKPFADITVFLGKDCTIYDKLDKID